MNASRFISLKLLVRCVYPVHVAPNLQLQSRTFAAHTRGISKLLVANRGEIACRVIATAQRLGIPTVAVYSEADRSSLHAKRASESYCIGGAAAKDSYLRGEKILEVAARCGATAIHPGYGFLSESASFADLCEQEGITFVGPPSSAIRAMGSKSEAKSLMEAAGVPLVPGYHGSDQEESVLQQHALKLGMPVLIKPVAGGGGKGMKIVEDPSNLLPALQSAKREAASSFGDDRLLVERYIKRSRHVEVQVFADAYGGAVYLFDRDCSVQRRHQKILEEAPAPGLSQEFQRHIGEAAVKAALAVGYRNAGTVEFILDCDSGEFYFMEMNTRLQVEHPVTEAITGVDLVEWQLHVAAGGKLPVTQEQLSCTGHAVEVRLYAENPYNNFLPGAGHVRRWQGPPAAGQFVHQADVRVDSGVQEGDDVGINYDPMIAKIITKGKDRQEALSNMVLALRNTQVCGLPTNVTFLQQLVSHPALAAVEQLDTGFIKTHADSLLQPKPHTPEAAALAAVLLLKHRSRQIQQTAGSPHGPWGIMDGKRLWSKHAQSVCLSVADQTQPLTMHVVYESASDFLVEETGAASAVGGAVPVKNVRMSETGRLEAEVGERLVQCDFCTYTHGADTVVVLWIDGVATEFRHSVPSWSQDASAVAQHGRITAPMTGKIVKVLVSEGDTVQSGDAVVVLEAMKMEHVVAAPQTGVVGAVLVHPGGQVQDGQLLVSIEERQE